MTNHSIADIVDYVEILCETKKLLSSRVMFVLTPDFLEQYKGTPDELRKQLLTSKRLSHHTPIYWRTPTDDDNGWTWAFIYAPQEPYDARSDDDEANGFYYEGQVIAESYDLLI